MLVMVPTLLYTLADQAHNTTSGQKCHTHAENSKNEFSFLFVEFAVICEGSAASLKRSARQFRYYFFNAR